MKLIAALILLTLVAGLGWVRLAPSVPARWHVDPLTAAAPGRAGTRLRPGPDAPTFALPPEDLLAAFDQVAMAQPRTRRLAGSIAEGRITYVSRTRWIGFPDYITVSAVPAPGGAQLAVLSRLRFGRGDLGVNRARLDRWLRLLETVID